MVGELSSNLRGFPLLGKWLANNLIDKGGEIPVLGGTYD